MKHEADRPTVDEALQRLSADIPPMPDGLHGRWMKQVEETPMTNETETRAKAKPRRISRTLGRVAAIAAAAVILIGGTVATRNLLDDAPRSTTARTAAGSLTSEAAEYEARDAMPVPMVASEESAADGAAYSYASYANGADVAAPAAVQTDRKLIRNVSLSVSAPDYDAALESIRAACTAAGGRITSLSERSKNATVVLRIPAANLDDFLAGAGGFGRITRREESTEDVTEQYRDLQGRLNTQLALRDRFTALLEKAATVEEMLEIETKLADVQYTIDSLTGSLNRTDSLVAESTVTISLKEEKPKEEIAAQERTLGQRIAYAFSFGWGLLGELLTNLGLFLVLALPFILIIAALWLLIRFLRKKRRR